MKPKFTTPCFIRKNTPELRRKLEELGYKHSMECEQPSNTLVAFESGLFSEKLFPTYPNCVVDCGTNETLFLAIAALREDSDKFQWFCDDYSDEFKSFFLCEYDNVDKHIHEKMDGWDCDGFHKATAEELINHFKN